MAFKIDLPCDGDTTTTLTDETRDGLMAQVMEHGKTCEKCQEKSAEMEAEGKSMDDKMAMINDMIKEV